MLKLVVYKRATGL